MSSNKNPFRKTETRGRMHDVLDFIRSQKGGVKTREVVAEFKRLGATPGSAAVAATNILSPRIDKRGSKLVQGQAYFMEVREPKADPETGKIRKRDKVFLFRWRKEPLPGDEPKAKIAKPVKTPKAKTAKAKKVKTPKAAPESTVSEPAESATAETATA
jgi:hypothetical protein